MHELSIAVSLTEIACQEADLAGAETVSKVYLKVGVFSGVVCDALRFAFDIAIEGTPLEGATLVIEEVPLVAFCPGCRCERQLPDLYRLRCPECDMPTPEIRRGQELEITAIEIF